MSISTLRRQVKNVAYNFSDAQVKVREATSNDPWGPTTALMSEIADLTHNPMSFTEIISMLWKRLNDHGKNWRHVYKSLVLLDYLIKCGSEKVAQQCRENIFSIETLKDFQHIEENRDQGLNVREKAKQMVSLLNDEERLRNERARFLLTRKRFIQSGSAISSDGTVRLTQRTTETGVIDSEFEEARPSSLGEEEMQLQIAMALSREECEKEEELRKSDAMRLQIALQESKKANALLAAAEQKIVSGSTLSQTALEDLLSLGLGEPVLVSTNSSHLPSTSAQAYRSSIIDPWSLTTSVNTISSDQNELLVYPSLNTTVSAMPIAPIADNDPWGNVSSTQTIPTDGLIPIKNSNLLFNNTLSLITNNSLAQNDPWAAFDSTAENQNSKSVLPLKESVAPNGNGSNLLVNGSATPVQGQQRPNVKTPETFLGENSSLVNLDNLMGPTNLQSKSASNPFMLGSSIATTTNPFAAQQRPSPSLHEMMNAQRSGNSSQPQQVAPTSPLNPFAL